MCLSTSLVLLVPVITAVAPAVVRFQQLKHLQYGGLQSSAKVTAAVGFIKWRHVDESAASVPKVQRGVIGVITQIPAKEQGRNLVVLGYYTQNHRDYERNYRLR